MKRTLIITLTGALLLASPMAFAQGETKSQVISMENLELDGSAKRPDFMKTSIMRNSKFKRLLRLKKSFVPKVLITAQEQSLVQ
jgi:hypothetical protein